VRNKQVADNVEYWYSRFHRYGYQINFPDLANKLENMAYEAMETREGSPEEKKAIGAIEDFCRALNSYLYDLAVVYVRDFKVWRHRGE
jgi:hypothetical protein